ncbi:MAG: SAM-dependent methyltransferase [Zoogloeaceae bacterium]|jgi:hypothetical protein|nr:SAM-dependent methyltransferase [Zoogloeaceae bacterium]
MKNTPPPPPPEIRPGQSLELLKTLHILTRDGKLNQDARRKLKQVYHLCNFLEPLLAELGGRDFHLVDHGAGKSYLGFILYDLFLKTRPEARVIGIETRTELVASAQALATTLAFERMAFFCRTVEAAMTMPEIPEQVEMVTALHACDTATDDAIRFALAKSARFIALVPCCQAEVASELRRRKNESFTATPLSELWRHPIHTREFGSHVTNVLRCLLLVAHGYQVTVTELVGWEHSMKNELIIARKIAPATTNPSARSRAEAILAALDLENLRERFVY